MTIAALDESGSAGSAAAPSLDRLVGRIDRARRRVLVQRVVASAGTGAAVGLAAFCFLRLVVAVAERAVPLRELALLALAVGTVAFAATAIRAALAQPSRGTMARRADAAFGLQERVSTAVELAAGEKQNTLARALLADAADRAGGISPRALAPTQLPRHALGLLALALFTAALLLAPPPSGHALAVIATPTPAAILTSAEAAAFADELHRIAGVAEEDALARGDIYLNAVAREMNEIADRVEAGGPVERAALRDDLARLFDYAADAYGGGAEGLATTADLGRLAAAAATGAAPGAPLPADAALPVVPMAEIAAGVEEAPSPGPGPSGPTRNDEPPPPPTMFGQIAPGPNAVAPAGGEIEAFDIDGYPVLPPCTGADCGTAGGNETAALGDANMPPGPGAPGAPPESATQIAPAADAGVGDGVAPGDGTRPLGDVPLPALAAMPDAGLMLLPDAGTGTAERIRMTVPPQPGTVFLAEVDRPEGVEWRPLAEGPIARTFLPPAERDISARYFARAAGAGP